MLAINFAVFRMGANSWMKVDAQTDLVETFSAFGAQWVQDVNQSTWGGTSISPAQDAVAVSRPTAEGEQLEFNDHRLLWKSYRLYYWSTNEIFRRDIKRLSHIEAPDVMERTDLGFGEKPLAFYANRGRVVLRGCKLFQVEKQGSTYVARIDGEKERYGSDRPEKISIQFRALPRN